MARYREKLVIKVLNQLILDVDEEDFEPVASLIKDLLEIQEARKALERYLEVLKRQSKTSSMLPSILIGEHYIILFNSYSLEMLSRPLQAFSRHP